HPTTSLHHPTLPFDRAHLKPSRRARFSFFLAPASPPRAHSNVHPPPPLPPRPHHPTTSHHRPTLPFDRAHPKLSRRARFSVFFWPQLLPLARTRTCIPHHHPPPAHPPPPHTPNCNP